MNKNQSLEKEKVKQIANGKDQANKDTDKVFNLFPAHKQENTIATMKDTGMA